ncbi:hypothetical protein BDK51DRAFT_47421, partial [Blyttiomyces helicus]
MSAANDKRASRLPEKQPPDAARTQQKVPGPQPNQAPAAKLASPSTPTASASRPGSAAAAAAGKQPAPAQASADEISRRKIAYTQGLLKEGQDLKERQDKERKQEERRAEMAVGMQRRAERDEEVVPKEVKKAILEVVLDREQLAAARNAVAAKLGSGSSLAGPSSPHPATEEEAKKDMRIFDGEPKPSSAKADKRKSGFLGFGKKSTDNLAPDAPQAEGAIGVTVIASEPAPVVEPSPSPKKAAPVGGVAMPVVSSDLEAVVRRKHQSGPAGGAFPVSTAHPVVAVTETANVDANV